MAGQYEVITLQENPQTQIVSQSKDRCTFVQKSEIFYHIIYDDSDLEIMCELGYNENSKICGKGRFNSTLRIPTDLKGMLILNVFLLFNQRVLHSLTFLKNFFCKNNLNKNIQKVIKEQAILHTSINLTNKINDFILI